VRVLFHPLGGSSGGPLPPPLLVMTEHESTAVGTAFQPLANPRRLRLSTADTPGGSGTRVPAERRDEPATEQVTREHRQPAAS
jgi:hypothetical protein